MSSFFGTTSRIFNTTTSVGGVFLKTLAKKMSGSYENTDFAKLLTEAAGDLKGPTLKLIQILAMIPGFLPDETRVLFESLQANAPAMGWSFVRRRMQQELGVDWQNLFKSFDQEASFAASLGQVHKAQTQDGKWVACKLQYPNMENCVEGDLLQLKMLLKAFGIYASMDFSNIQDEVYDRLQEELDYKKEAHNLLTFKDIFKNHAFINVPTYLSSLSTQKLLTMEWVEGKSLKDFLNTSMDLRKQIARNLFVAWYYPLYQHGVLHGDPHLGNYRIHEDASISVLDFGCVRYFSESFVSGILELYQALEKNNYERCVHAYELWGFTDLTKELIDVLNIWARFLYSPLLEDKEQPLLKAPKDAHNAAKSVFIELKKRGGLTPPREFVFMDRAAVGIASAMVRLDISLNWYELFWSLIPVRSVLKKF